MVKGYEFEKDRFVIFSPDELKALQESPSQTIDIVAFIPDKAVDPIFYDKAYFLAPDKRGAKPYNLLIEAMRESGRCALAKWAWKAKQYVVQVRPAEDGLVLQQLLYADEVRSLKELDIEKVTVSRRRAQAGDAADRPDLARTPTTRRCSRTRRRSASSPRSTRRSPASRSWRRSRSSRSRRRPGHRPDRGAARQPGHARRRQGARPRPRAKAAPEPAPAEAAKERKGVKRAPKVAEEAVARAAPGPGRGSDAQADRETPYTIAQHPGDAGPFARRHHRPHRCRLRHADARRRATSTASPSATSCCCAPRAELQAARIPPRKILRSLRRLKPTAARPSCRCRGCASPPSATTSRCATAARSGTPTPASC